ncbi:transglycosylase domain-containing protein [Actinoplanes subtropicus]|uniref:transglycosylase domain-containing protein n=1 Tax=Actinoplanes subtropicus TaxID=543632 RepID=UPI00068F992A|nr:transglycosylase domain-containing protein [Actinoplanes subtropicus]
MAAGKIAPLVRAGLIAGLVIAGLAYPLAALAGIGVKAGSKALAAMPEELTEVPTAQTSYVYARDGKTLLTTFYEEYRKQVSIEDMSPYITEAIVASEDARFYEHHGVDAKGVARAFVANRQAGGVSQGASTLTMQYVRMALRDSAKTPQDALEATEQTTQRKLREMRLAIELEKKLSKQEILERYLNSAYFGHQAYGIYAASQIFFSKTPKQLNLNEAALLAGLVKAPSAYDPAVGDQKAATDRRNYVIDQMAKMHTITPAQAASSKTAKIQLRLTTPPNDCISIPQKHNDWGYFCDYLKSWWQQEPAFGRTPDERLENLRRGGYRIVTSLDPRIQASAMSHVLDKEKKRSRYAHGQVIIEPNTGRVLSMAVNRTYSLEPNPKDRNYPNTVNALLGGGTMAGYQAGSTFKIFTMLAALDSGLPLDTSIYAPEQYVSKYIVARGPASCGHHWCPKNSSKSDTGRQTMWSGFGKSVNTYFVQLEERVGADKAVAMAKRLGLTWRTDVDRTLASPEHAGGWGAFTLGVSDATPLELANVFATLAAEGNYCEPLPVRAILNPDGSKAKYRGQLVAGPRCHRVFSVDVARAATDAARCPTGYGSARGSCGGWSTSPMVYATLHRPVAGKSGTTDNNRTAWFCGFTPQLAGAAFVADPDDPNDFVGGGRSTMSKYTFAQTLNDALKGQPKLKFTPPSKQIAWHGDRNGTDPDDGN